MKSTIAMLCAVLLSTCQVTLAQEGEAVVKNAEATTSSGETMWKEKPKTDYTADAKETVEDKQELTVVAVEEKAEEKAAPSPGEESEQSVLEWLENWLSEHNAKKREEKAVEAIEEKTEDVVDPS